MFLTVTICVSDSSNERNKQYYVTIMLDDKQSIITPKKKSWFMFSRLSQVHYPLALEP